MKLTVEELAKILDDTWCYGRGPYPDTIRSPGMQDWRLLAQAAIDALDPAEAAREAVDAEREACLEIVDRNKIDHAFDDNSQDVCDDILRAIKARGKEVKP